MNREDDTCHRTPLGDLTNITNQDDNERRRQRDRARRASMSAEEKYERNKKRRESYHLKKAQQTISSCSKGDDHGLNNENHEPGGNNDWVHKNMSKDSHQLPGDYSELNGENHESDDNNDWLHMNMSYNSHDIANEDEISQLLVATEDSLDISNLGPQDMDAKERKRARERSRYAAMSVEQRRLLYTTPARKESKRCYKRKQVEKSKNTLNHASIAIENPNYTPDHENEHHTSNCVRAPFTDLTNDINRDGEDGTNCHKSGESCA